VEAARGVQIDYPMAQQAKEREHRGNFVPLRSRPLSPNLHSEPYAAHLEADFPPRSKQRGESL